MTPSNPGAVPDSPQFTAPVSECGGGVGALAPHHHTTGPKHPGILNTTPNPSTCPRCHAPTWQGVIEGFETRLDPGFLDAHAELLARLEGRHIYQTIPGTNLPELQWRSVTHILAPPERQPSRILATHICTPPPHPPLEDIWPRRQAADLPEEPPF